jgi:hypothetical protein
MAQKLIFSTLSGKAVYSDSAFWQTQGVANEAIIAVADDRVIGNLKER